MGEAVYSMKVRFPKGSLKKKLPQIQAFFKEGLESYNFWQDHRGDYVVGEPEGFDFWKEFEKKFPLVTPYVKTLTETRGARGKKQYPVWGKDHSNGLAGKLDFAQEESDIDNMQYNTTNVGDELLFSSMVWHFADWTPLMDFVIKHFGGLKGNWASDEGGGGGYPSLEDHKEIVSALLKKKEVLPTLMHIHPDLDELISVVMKS